MARKPGTEDRRHGVIGLREPVEGRPPSPPAPTSLEIEPPSGHDSLSGGVTAEDPQEGYRLLFDGNPLPMWVYDLETLAVLAVNDSAVRKYGYSREEFLDLTIRDLRPAEDVRALDTFLRKDRAELVEAGIWRHRRKDGSVLLAEVTSHALPFGGHQARLVVATDVTERVRAEARASEAEGRYRTLVEQIPGVTYVAGFGPGAEWMYVSPQIEVLLGYTAEAWMADPGLWYRCLHQDDRDRVLAEEQEEVAAGPEELPSEYRMRTRDGRMIWVRDQAYVIRDGDGRPLHYQGVLFDITELKRAEEALRETFERERVAADRLRSLDELKNTFLSAVSHELRTPLASILGFAITLQGPGATLPPEERGGLLDRLIVNAKKLDRLLTDLLDLDRLARGPAEPRRGLVDVGLLIQRVVEDAGIPGHPVHLDVQKVTVEVDGPKVERIVENLLLNAAKHTPTGTAIHVMVRPEAGGVLIVIEDEGPGVPEELRERLFQPFERGSEAPGHAAGTGIGLSLVEGFARLHGGRAWVQDRPGGGSSFHVFLPGTPDIEGSQPDSAVSSG